MPLQRRLPKRGFTNLFRKQYNIINIGSLNRFTPNADLDGAALMEAGLVKKLGDGIKLLGKGDIDHAIVIRVQKASKAAREKIEAAGGKVEIV